MPRLLHFTFYFLLFAAQLAPSLPFTDRRLLTFPDHPLPSHRLCRPPEPLLFLFCLSLSLSLSLSRPRPMPASHRLFRPTEPLLVWLSRLFVAPLSLHQNRVSGAKSAPFTLEYDRSRGFFRASGNSKSNMLIFVFLPEGFWFTFGKGGGAG